MNDLQTLRRHLKQARLALSPAERRQSQRRVLERLLTLPEFRRARRVAGYIGNRGEIDPFPLLEVAVELGKRVYLPHLHPFLPGRLWFYRWLPGDRLLCNRFGIPEPRPRRDHRLPASQLDVAVVPLLGFDADCHRLGMGGGYYDRTFAFLRHAPRRRRPLLIGLAHDLQRVDDIEQRPWDIPLDAVITPHHTYRRRTAHD